MNISNSYNLFDYLKENVIRKPKKPTKKKDNENDYDYLIKKYNDEMKDYENKKKLKSGGITFILVIIAVLIDYIVIYNYIPEEGKYDINGESIARNIKNFDGHNSTFF